MDSINYYFSSDNKKESGLRYLFQTFYMFQSRLWKGRRKDKDSPTSTDGQKEYLEDLNIRNRISDADFFKLVALPPLCDRNEWLTTHAVSFFNHVNLLYGAVSEYCTTSSCPSMTAPDNVQYFWYDDRGKKCKHAAPQYIDYVMTHIQKIVSDESVFPTKFGVPFPADLETTVKRIHKYLFHVLAHMYHAHYKLLKQLDLHAHLNTVFTHFMVFTSKFALLQDKDSDILLLLFSLLLKNLADPTGDSRKLKDGTNGHEKDFMGQIHSKSLDISTTSDRSQFKRADISSSKFSNLKYSRPLSLWDIPSTTENTISVKHPGLKQTSATFEDRDYSYSPLSKGSKSKKEKILPAADNLKSSDGWYSSLQLSAT